MKLPRLGMGTWHMGERPRARARGGRAARGPGPRHGPHRHRRDVRRGRRGERRGRSDPRPARRGLRGEQVLSAPCLAREAAGRVRRVAARSLGIERIDLYLLHWRGSVPLEETVATLERAGAPGARSRAGASPISTSPTWRSWSRVPGGEEVAANQVLYNLARRGIEFDLLPWCEARGIDGDGVFAARRGPPAAPSRARRGRAAPRRDAGAGRDRMAARKRGVVAIPKAATHEHVQRQSRRGRPGARRRGARDARARVSRAAAQTAARDDLKSAHGDTRCARNMELRARPAKL